MNDEYRLTPGGYFASLNGQHARQSPVEIHLPGWKSQATQELSSELLFRCTRIHGPYEPETGFLTRFRWRVQSKKAKEKNALHRHLFEIGVFGLGYLSNYWT